nr:signal peptidase I [Pseudomonadota bacterium]
MVDRDSIGMILLVAIVAGCLYVWYTTSDFALALVLMTAAFGIVWALDRLLFQHRRIERVAAAGEKPREPMLIDYARSFFPVILAVLLFRTFIVEPFRIPSGSMMPTLLVGDFVLVNKFAYGLRLPVTDAKIVDIGEPKRGDIAVFKYPPNPKEDYIKRIVGLPGDRIQVKAGQLYINGTMVQRQPAGEYVEEEDGRTALARKYVETLPNGRVHDIIKMSDEGEMNNTPEFKVPEGHVFAMG